MKITIILYLIIFFQFNLLYCHRCGTNLLKNNISMIKITSIEKNKRQLTDIYRPINIKVDMTYLKSQHLLDEEKISKLETIFAETLQSMSSIISVQHYIINDDVSNSIKELCGIPTFDPELNTGFIQYDVLIFPLVDNDQILANNVLAAATPCLISNSNYKPMAGIVLINKDLTFQKYDSKFYMKNLLFHELTHVLGFHPTFFNNLNLIYTKTINNEEYTYIKSPKVLEKAKIHFGCDNIKGLQLENQGQTGSVGSHWESRYMLGDYMISSDYTEVVISDITLALLEDTGFYKIKYYTGGLFRFGKNQGCAFLEKKCLYNKGEDTSFSNEFCTIQLEPTCAGSHISRGDCYIKNYPYQLNDKYRYYQDRKIGGMIVTDYCPVSFIYETKNNDYYYPKSCKHGKKENEYEVIGENSMCFESSLDLSEKETICYEISCDRSNKQFTVYLGERYITCPGNEIIIENPNGFSGEIKCPNYNLICTSEKWCNDMFDCIEKGSEWDLSTYDYINNKQALLQRDNINLAINDANDFDDNNSKLQLKKYLLFFYYFYYLYLFLIHNN